MMTEADMRRIQKELRVLSIRDRVIRVPVFDQERARKSLWTLTLVAVAAAILVGTVLLGGKQ